MPHPASAQAGPWSPLRQPVFRALWLAILLGNVGTWMHDVAAAWLMAERTASPLWVSAVQAATTLPVVLLALVAGTLADIVDRRRYLLLAQCWMFAVATVLALLAGGDRLQPASLLALTFALGCGAAMAMPAQAAVVSELVPRPMLAPAVALNSLGMNIARSLGPALGGVVVARWGAAWAFAVNAATFLVVAVVLLRWRRQVPAADLPPEHFLGGLRAGLRYAAHAPALRAVLVRAAAFFVFAGALPALLPVVVRSGAGGGAGTFGLLLGCVGVGAIAGALLLPALRARLGTEALVRAASLLCAATLLGLAWIRELAALAPVMLANGLAWICVLSSLQVGAQTSVPAWVRARALSLYILVFASGMAGGSLLWGAVAQQGGTPLALSLAAACLVLATLAVARFRIGGGEQLDLAPSAHWPQPVVAAPDAAGRGPVLVTVEYLIDASDRDAFEECVQLLGRSRRRDGAMQWGVMEDAARPGVHLEYFFLASWHDHLRQHAHVTGEERALQDRLHRLHRGEALPQVRHFLGPAP
ncbi:MFS transporter [Pseudoxanthomonas sp. 10H]|uniref:MFS transporter n=1 Tax=Pseudoxanthomonas sp. 10H TaxID=3242729 RepID=UPI0035571803